MELLSKEKFDKDIELSGQYGGDYEKYKQAGGTYNINDVISVFNTGKLPIPQKTQSDDLSAQYTQVYNDAVNKNNAMARNQALNAGSEYREINRNINEINKAQGTANTGYAGDTSIDAYNAYINTVNSAYNNANNANNELYSYYLDQMAQERDRQDANETKVVSALSEILSDKYSDGYVTGDAKNKAINYLTTMYGSIENVPTSIKAYLGSINGMTTEGDIDKSVENTYVSNHNYTYKNFESHIIGGKEASTIEGEDDFFKLKIKDSNGIVMKYRLTTTGEKINNENILRLIGKETGSFLKYNSKYYVRDKNGNVYEAVRNNGKPLQID